MSPAREPTLEEWERRVEATFAKIATIPETERKPSSRRAAGRGNFAPTCNDRARLSRDEGRAARTPDREPHQALARQHERGAPRRRERIAADADDRSPLRQGIHLLRGQWRSRRLAGRRSPSLVRMGITPERKLNVGAFSEGQRRFLEYHRDNVLRMSALRAGRG